MSGKTFRLYTKTFGGKISTDLQRASPYNFFGKNFNKGSLKLPTKKKIKSKRQFLYHSKKIKTV